MLGEAHIITRPSRIASPALHTYLTPPVPSPPTPQPEQKKTEAAKKAKEAAEKAKKQPVVELALAETVKKRVHERREQRAKAQPPAA